MQVIARDQPRTTVFAGHFGLPPAVVLHIEYRKDVPLRKAELFRNSCFVQVQCPCYMICQSRSRGGLLEISYQTARSACHLSYIACRSQYFCYGFSLQHRSIAVLVVVPRSKSVVERCFVLELSGSQVRYSNPPERAVAACPHCYVVVAVVYTEAGETLIAGYRWESCSERCFRWYMTVLLDLCLVFVSVFLHHRGLGLHCAQAVDRGTRVEAGTSHRQRRCCSRHLTTASSTGPR